MMAERERFAKNLALMASGPGEAAKGEQNGSTRLREDKETQNGAGTEAMGRNRAKWTAIRNHISRTMETIDSRSSLR